MRGHDDIEARLRECRTDRPSEALRQRVLHEASRALPTRVAWSDRLWFSRPVRVAAAVLVAALLLASVAERRLSAGRLDAEVRPEAETPSGMNRVVTELGLVPGAFDRPYRIHRAGDESNGTSWRSLLESEEL